MKALLSLLVVLVSLVLPATASAFTVLGAGTCTRVFNVVGGTTAGMLGFVGPEKHRGIVHGYGETASGSSNAARGLGALSQAGKFGIQPYNTLTKALKGTGLQAHHLIEQRVAGLLGQNAREGLSVAVTQAEHQAFTNAWRARIPYGPAGTGAATKESVLQAARDIYAGYPEILGALGL